MSNWKVGVIAVVQHAISKDDPMWGKQLASFLENQAEDLRLVFGPSGKKHRIPAGLRYMEPTPVLAMLAAYKYAGGNPGADEASIVDAAKVNVYDAKQVLRWVNSIRNAAKKTGHPGTECTATKTFGTGKRTTSPQIKVIL